jgi:hypothetical protein
MSTTNFYKIKFSSGYAVGIHGESAEAAEEKARKVMDRYALGRVENIEVIKDRKEIPEIY